MRKFIFIFSIIFSNLFFSDESIEIFLDEQHKNLFGYIEKNIELMAITENLVFTDPYFNAEMNSNTEGLEKIINILSN